MEKINSKQIEYAQRTPEWHEARLGKISSSNVSKIMTEARKKGDISKTAMSYIVQLAAETMTGQKPDITNNAMQWGTDNESEAIKAYEAETFNKVEECTFFECLDYPLFGGSPDGLIKNGIIEVKCPFNTEHHINTILDGMPKDHIPQIQSNILLTNSQFCDFISYDPRMLNDKRLYIQRIERDEEYIAKIVEKVDFFSKELAKILEKLG